MITIVKNINQPREAEAVLLQYIPGNSWLDDRVVIASGRDGRLDSWKASEVEVVRIDLEPDGGCASCCEENGCQLLLESPAEVSGAAQDTVQVQVAPTASAETSEKPKAPARGKKAE